MATIGYAVPTSSSRRPSCSGTFVGPSGAREGAEGGGRSVPPGRGTGKPMYLQAQTSYAGTDDEVRLAVFDQWHQCGLGSDVLADLLQLQVDNCVISTATDSQCGQTAGASTVSSNSRTGAGSLLRAVPSPACGRSASSQSHRRTAHSASEKVWTVFPGHSTAPVRVDAGSAWNRSAPTVYNPSRHGPARSPCSGAIRGSFPTRAPTGPPGTWSRASSDGSAPGPRPRTWVVAATRSVRAVSTAARFARTGTRTARGRPAGLRT